MVPSESKRIVLEGRPAAVGAWNDRNDGLDQPVLKVSCEASAGSVAEGIAVCVVGNCEGCRRTLNPSRL